MKVYEVAGGWAVGDGKFAGAIFPSKIDAETFLTGNSTDTQEGAGMIDAARVEEIRAALTCAYQVPEWGEITDMAHELFKFIDTLRADVGVAESELFEKRERSKLRQEIDRLRAENDAYREVLRDIAYNTSTSIPFAAPPETYIVGQLRSCIGRAARALNPDTDGLSGGVK